MRFSHRAWILLSFAVLLLASRPAAHVANATTPIYVNDDATGANDGTTWADAYTSLQTALATAGLGREIWVAAGTYTPSAPAGREATFELANDVQVYGSFAGNEQSLDDRELSPIYSSVLTGEIGAFTQDDNVYHVVTVPNGSSPRLDGFQVRRGNASGGVSNGATGGGILNTGSQGYFEHLWIADNAAADKGGGVYEYPGSNNYLDVLFDDNEADVGAGIAIMSGATVLRESTFLSNDATSNASAFFVAGFGTQAYVTNITVLGGTAPEASAIDVATTAKLFLTNASISGAGSPTATPPEATIRIAEAGASALVRSTILWANGGPELKEQAGTLTISASIVDGGCAAPVTCTQISTEDPLFELPGANHGGFVPTLSIPAISPAVDTGVDSVCPTYDARGGLRKFDGDGDGTGHCDMGSFEFIAEPDISLVQTAETVAEGDPYLHIRLKLSHRYPLPVTVKITAIGGTATPGTDFTNNASGYVLASNPVSTNFSLNLGVKQDALDEPNETAVFRVSNAVNGTIAGPTDSTTTITDDDNAPAISFETAKSSGPEHVKKPQIVVKLSAPSGYDIKPGFSIESTAKPGTDFTGPSLVIPAGKTSAALDWSVIDDGIPEATEVVALTLEPSAQAVPGAIKKHTYRILNDDRPSKCFGLATTIYGGPGDDLIKGTPGADVIDGRGGSDRITGLGGNDVICGRGGKDVLRGGSGNDRVDGGAGPDTLRGGGGNDQLLGSTGNDSVRGETGRDRLAGGPGSNDTCDGGAGTDTLTAAHGCEHVSGVP